MSPETEGMIYELKREIEVLKSNVAQLSGELDTKVNKTDIINQINISQEGIRISVDKITINSETMIEQAANSSFKI